MDKVTHYKEIAHKVLLDTADYAKIKTEIDLMLAVDIERGQFLLISDYWFKDTHTYGTLVHIQVKEDGKVWLRCDNTNLEVGQDLLNAGVPKQDLVVGFHHPELRKYTDYALG